MAVILNAILQLESQGEDRESAIEAVLMVGCMWDGISNQELIRWLSWRGFHLARNPGLSNTMEYDAGEFSFTTRSDTRTEVQSSHKPSQVYELSRRRRHTRTSAEGKRAGEGPERTGSSVSEGHVESRWNIPGRCRRPQEAATS